MLWAGLKFWGKPEAAMYIGRSVCLLRAHGHALISITHAPTMPLAAVLSQLAERCRSSGVQLSRFSLHVDLSAALCQGYIATPRVASLTMSLKADIAQAMGIPVSNLAVQRNTEDPRIIAGSTQAMIRMLTEWASSQRAKLHSVQPLWASVTQAHRAKNASIVALMLCEPDGLTLLTQGTASHALPVWQFVASQPEPHAQELQQQRFKEHHLQTEQVAQFRFNPHDDQANESGLSRWMGHWEVL